MLASELIMMLQAKIERHGDLPVVGGYLVDDRPPVDVRAIDEQGVEFGHGGFEPAGFFIQ